MVWEILVLQAVSKSVGTDSPVCRSTVAESLEDMDNPGVADNMAAADMAGRRLAADTDNMDAAESPVDMDNPDVADNMAGTSHPDNTDAAEDNMAGMNRPDNTGAAVGTNSRDAADKMAAQDTAGNHHNNRRSAG
jgi:hypothetical protein